jgi:hypothetical protein
MKPGSAIPVYEVEFIPLERRLSDRRVEAVRATTRAAGLDRRKLSGRRADDRSSTPRS